MKYKNTIIFAREKPPRKMTKKNKFKSKTKPDLAEAKKQKMEDGLVSFSFTKQNYRLLILGIFLITLGFLLMIGGGSDDPNVFSDKIFNFQRLTLAPILVIAGYIIEIFAIMKKPK